MSTVDNVLQRLEAVKSTGPGRWLARCPAHADKRPSLSLRECADGRLLMHCFAGCDVGALVGAIGLELHDLFPPDPVYGGGAGPVRKRGLLSPSDALRLIEFETLLVSVAAQNLAAGHALRPLDLERLNVAARRIQATVDGVAA